jgi:hypothetical protein
MLYRCYYGTFKACTHIIRPNLFDCTPLKTRIHLLDDSIPVHVVTDSPSKDWLTSKPNTAFAHPEETM